MIFKYMMKNYMDKKASYFKLRKDIKSIKKEI